MTTEIDATKFTGPAELATAIRDAMGQLYVDDVVVKCAKSRHRITATTCDAVCRGLLIASEITEGQVLRAYQAGGAIDAD